MRTADPDPQPLEPRPPDDADVLARLEAARRETLGRLAGLTGSFDDLVAASRDSNADDEHDPEGATIAFERSQLDSHVVRARAQLVEIDAARERLAAGRYGWCEACGAAVPAARLEARPTARTCVACAVRAGGVGGARRG